MQALVVKYGQHGFALTNNLYIVRIAIVILSFLFCACQPQPEVWDGPTLTRDRAHLTVGEMSRGEKLPLVDQSFLARPAWATTAKHALEGTLEIKEGVLTYPKEKEYYPGENIFPTLELNS